MAGFTACSDDQPIAAVLANTGYTSSTARIGWVDVAAFQRMVFTVSVGAVGAGESLALQALQATDTNGSGAKALQNPKSIAALTASNSVVMINVAGPDIDANNAFRYASVKITSVTTATNTATGTVLSGDCRGQPEVTNPVPTKAVTVVL